MNSSVDTDNGAEPADCPRLRRYAPPTFTRLGTVAELTHGNSGSAGDASPFAPTQHTP